VAAPLRLGACGLPPVKDGYAAFWDAWGRRVTVADTERLIDSKVEEGAALVDIVAGVLRFRKYCVDTGKPPRMKPAAFVHGEKWRDDWQLYPAEPAKAKSGARKKPPKTRKETKSKRFKNPWQEDPVWFEWERKQYAHKIAIIRRHSHEFENGIAKTEEDINRIRELLKPWNLANPEPNRWKNIISGEAWGKRWDNTPKHDWSPSNQDSG